MPVAINSPIQMKKPKSPSAVPKGSILGICNKLRKKCNKLTAEERIMAWEAGMRKIYNVQNFRNAISKTNFYGGLEMFFKNRSLPLYINSYKDDEGHLICEIHGGLVKGYRETLELSCSSSGKILAVNRTYKYAKR